MGELKLTIIKMKLTLCVFAIFYQSIAVDMLTKFEIAEPIIDIGGMCAFFRAHFLKKQMSFLTISNEILFYQLGRSDHTQGHKK